MARGRIIANAITKDLAINNLSDDTCRLAFTWLISFVDKEGRTYGDPALVRSMLFPRRIDITIEQIEGYIREWQEAGFIQWYQANGDWWIQFINFDKNQPGLRKDREPDSIIPPPPALPDDCRQSAGNEPEQCPENGMEWNGMESKLLAADAAVAEPPISEKANFPEQEKPPKQATGRNAVKAELEQRFLALTRLKRPSLSTQRQKRAYGVQWSSPLLEIAALVDDDVGRAAGIISSAVTQMRRDNLTISTPQSILKVCQHVAATRAEPIPPDELWEPIPPEVVAARDRAIAESKAEQNDKNGNGASEFVDGSQPPGIRGDPDRPWGDIHRKAYFGRFSSSPPAARPPNLGRNNGLHSGEYTGDF